ncbi:MAG: DUF2059 domain-containing protein [Magnetovibrio sp.]|nr:DUF2059 domain-containing protein [Magnetovibrio sp.]
MSYHPVRTFVIAIALAFASPLAAHADNSIEERTAAAERYISTMNYEQNMRTMGTQFSEQLPPEVRQAFIEKMATRDYSKMKKRMALLMIKTFTTEELNTMSDFYGSEVWKNVKNKMPEFSATMGHITNTEITAVMAEISGE